MSISIRKIVLNTTLFFCLIPYISFLPLDSDLQPISLAFCIFSLLLLKKFKLNNIVYTQILFFLFCLLLIRANSFFNLSEFFVSFFSVISTIVIIIFSYNYFIKYGFQSFGKILWSVVLFYLTFALLQALSPPIFALFDFLYNQKVIYLGIRGWSSLTPEPTDLGFTLSVILFSYIILHNEGVLKLNYLLVGLIVVLILGTLSNAGILTLLVLALILTLSKKPFLALFLVPFMILAITAGENSDIRPVRIISNIFLDPLSVIEFTSLFYRVFENQLAVLLSIDNYFLPYGFSSFSNVVTDLNEYVDILHTTYPSRVEFISNYIASPPESAKNIFSRYIIELGIFFIIYLILLFWFVGSLRVSGLTILLTFSIFILYIVQSFPLFYPPIWLLLGMISSISSIRNNAKSRVNNTIFSK